MHTEPTNFNQFMTEVQQDLQERLSRMYPDTRVEMQDVARVQGESYRGLMIRQAGHRASPVFNLQPLYDQLPFRTYENVLEDVVRKAVDVIENPLNIVPEEFTDYGFMKDKLVTQVISANDNAARLAELPHRKMMDMAVIYRFMLGDDGRGNSISVTVNNAMLETYGISEAQLHADALQAMEQNHTYSIRPMGMVLAGLDPSFDEPVGPPGLYVASMDTKMYGAAVLTQPDFMEKAAEVEQGDFFVLPSSIHEVLILKDDGLTDYRELEEMVRTINATEVAPSDRLTDNVYHYDAKERIFETAKEHADRMAEKAVEKRSSVLKELAEQKQKSYEYTPRHHRPPERSSAVL